MHVRIEVFAAAILVFAVASADEAKGACSADAIARTAQRFEIHADGLYDRRTKLTWDFCALGQTTAKDTCAGTPRFVNLAEAKNAAAAKRGTWRVPTAQELVALLDTDCAKPAAAALVFPGLAAFQDGGCPFWTSTPAGFADMYAIVDVWDGFVDAHSSGFAVAVRFVKG